MRAECLLWGKAGREEELSWPVEEVRLREGGGRGRGGEGEGGRG